MEKKSFIQRVLERMRAAEAAGYPTLMAPAPDDNALRGYSFTREELHVAGWLDSQIDAAVQRGAFTLKEPAQLPAPPPTSIVGDVVVNLNNGLQNFRNQEMQLTADITAKTEALRQIKAAIKSIELGLTEICDDPALTDGERAIASDPMNRLEAKFAEAVDAVANG